MNYDCCMRGLSPQVLRLRWASNAQMHPDHPRPHHRETIHSAQQILTWEPQQVKIYVTCSTKLDSEAILSPLQNSGKSKTSFTHLSKTRLKRHFNHKKFKNIYRENHTYSWIAPVARHTLLLGKGTSREKRAHWHRPQVEQGKPQRFLPALLFWIP